MAKIQLGAYPVLMVKRSGSLGVELRRVLFAKIGTAYFVAATALFYRLAARQASKKVTAQVNLAG
jgi:hypothetical protein